ncbi:MULTISPECIES: substrate-binding domain-containing protein [Arthrobacter]|uniref:Phosphate-binding protein n=1 Tax=Arthrobacter oryzae TaxID=409290 RepID=A0A3N0C3A3_9MICC|nr:MULTISPECIES: substrate-binding domain-containing protein [Arthrobacter]QYF89699.1 substrate-binding domain-containing protein [Arthrobacter sp. PAMC25284]RNL57105.1 hypothetical protein D7003_07985 [Arthrobacter oryzae]
MRNWPTGGILACTVLAGIGLAGCSGGASPTAIRGALTAIGSPVQKDPIRAWSNAWTKDNNATSLNYSPDGADVGISALSTGQAYFAALDAPLTPDQQDQTQAACGPSGAFSVPVSVTTLGVAFNMPSIRSLKLTPDVLAGIFTGTVTRWDAREIATINPGVTLPSGDIIPVTATTPSAETTAATTYLSTAADWTAGVVDAWPTPENGQAVKKQTDVAEELDQTAGAIAFMDLGSIGTRFDTALLPFGGGFVRISKDSSALGAQQGSTRTTPTGVEFTLPETSEQGYPLGVVNYQAFCRSYKNPQLAGLVKSWGKFVLSSDGQVASTYFANVASPGEDAIREARTLIQTIGAAQ